MQLTCSIAGKSLNEATAAAKAAVALVLRKLLLHTFVKTKSKIS